MICVCVQLLSHIWLCNPMDSPGSSVHGISQARILGSDPCLLHLLYWQAGFLLLEPPGKSVLYFYLTFECSNTKYPTNNINFKIIVMESINVDFFTHILPTYIYYLHATDSNIFHIIAYFSFTSKTKRGMPMYFLTSTHTTRMLWNFIKVWLFVFSL